jgi:hypothetical protein
MAGNIQIALAAQRRKGLLAQMPSWLDREACTISENSSNINVSFRCPCRDQRVASQTVYIGKMTDVQQLAVKLASAVQGKHGLHNGTPEAPEEEHAAAGERAEVLQSELRSVKRKLTVAENQVAQADVKALRADAAQQSARQARRIESVNENRRQDIDPENLEPLSTEDKSTALNAPRSGLLSCIKLWSRGSIAAVLQLVMALVHHFKLQEQVAGELGLRQNETDRYIVDRARDALQVLKATESEEQREEYRIVLTALAPEKVEQRPSGRRLRTKAGS